VSLASVNRSTLTIFKVVCKEDCQCNHLTFFPLSSLPPNLDIYLWKKCKKKSIFKFLGAFGAGYLFNSKIICAKKIKKLKRKQINEQRDVYSQYYEDVYKLQKHTNELYNYVGQLEDAIKEVELEAVQRDYEEFKMPDLDGDERISRAEFNDYVKNYLANYPGLTEKDYPKFEDFDHDKDGFISFQEYAQQMALQVQQMKSK
jgi:hypothetical protein